MLTRQPCKTSGAVSPDGSAASAAARSRSQATAGEAAPGLPFRHGMWTLSCKRVVPLTAESAEWSLTWSHAVRVSAVNPGGKGLGIVVYEQLSMHNLTLTEKSTGRAFADVTDGYGFTEWSDPA